MVVNQVDVPQQVSVGEKPLSNVGLLDVHMEEIGQHLNPWGFELVQEINGRSSGIHQIAFVAIKRFIIKPRSQTFRVLTKEGQSFSQPTQCLIQ